MLATHLLKILRYDLWWGIDGELKSKFGELTENFWQSSSGESPIQAKKFQAIYFANGEVGGGSGGKSLSEVGDSKGKKLISTRSGDKVQSLFNFCVGAGQGGNGCKEGDKKVSVKLFGSDDLGKVEKWKLRWSD